MFDFLEFLAVIVNFFEALVKYPVQTLTFLAEVVALGVLVLAFPEIAWLLVGLYIVVLIATIVYFWKNHLL